MFPQVVQSNLVRNHMLILYVRTYVRVYTVHVSTLAAFVIGSNTQSILHLSQSL